MRPWAEFKGCFVTGTDTGVGKTLVSAALLHWLAGNCVSAVGFKPVAAGMSMLDGEWVNDDVRALRNASSIVASDAEVGPFQYRAACAPHIACALEGRAISRNAVIEAARVLQRRADRIVVEGVGGFCVPLGPGWDSSHIACALSLPVILVVGLRLGCLSHSLLTAESIRARRLTLAGWIATTIDPNLPHRDEVVAALHQEMNQRFGAPSLGVVPWLAPPTPRAVIAHLDETALRATLALPENLDSATTCESP